MLRRNAFLIQTTLALVLCLLCNNIYSQDQDMTVYYDGVLKQTQRRHAVYTLQLSFVDTDIYEGTIFSDKKEVKAVGQWKRIDKHFLEHGQFVYFYPNGQIESRGEFERGVKIGNWERYEENGNRKSDRYYNPESATLIRQTQGIK